MSNSKSNPLKILGGPPRLCKGRYSNFMDALRLKLLDQAVTRQFFCFSIMFFSVGGLRGSLILLAGLLIVGS